MTFDDQCKRYLRNISRTCAMIRVLLWVGIIITSVVVLAAMSVGTLIK